MSKIPKVREKIVLFGRSKFNIAEKIEWIRGCIFDMLGIWPKVGEVKLCDSGQGWNVDFEVYSPTGCGGHSMLIGSIGGMFSYIVNDECPVPTDIVLAGGSGLFSMREASEKLELLRKLYHEIFNEVDLRKEWKEKLACRDYAEKYGFSLYEVYGFCKQYGADCHKLMEFPVKRERNVAIRNYVSFAQTEGYFKVIKDLGNETH